jgi:single-strand DNA-binding protein
MPKSFMAELDEDFVYVCGHLGKDAETKTTTTGKQLTKDSIAVNRGQELADWYTLVWWDNEQAERLVKGQAIRLVGKLSKREYNGKEYVDITVKMFEAYKPRNRDEAPW